MWSLDVSIKSCLKARSRSGRRLSLKAVLTCLLVYSWHVYPLLQHSASPSRLLLASLVRGGPFEEGVYLTHAPPDQRHLQYRQQQQHFRLTKAICNTSSSSSSCSSTSEKPWVNNWQGPWVFSDKVFCLTCFPVALACLGERPTGSAPQASTQSIPCTQPCHFLPQTSLIPISATHNKQ